MLNEIINEIVAVLENVDQNDLNSAVSIIDKKKRVFVAGAGRSGLQGKGFGMRLMHIGYEVYIVGETITPAMHAGDILVAISGSGTTEKVLHVVKKAKALNATIIGVTSKRDSTLGEIADITICVPGASRKDKKAKSIQLLSTLFDQTTHIVLDELALKIADRDGTTNDFAKTMHSNVE